MKVAVAASHGELFDSEHGEVGPHVDLVVGVTFALFIGGMSERLAHFDLQEVGCKVLF